MFPDLQNLLHEQCRLNPDQTILVGVSGGADSLCLLGTLSQAGYPVLAAHFDHRLRPESSAQAEALSAMLARRGIPLVVESGDVRGLAEREGYSIEQAARHLRYHFLFAQARAQNAQAVAVGHTADDQVETVLMHLLRGAGLTGLKGMPYRTILEEFDPGLPLVRPLLGVWREEVERFCRVNGFQPLEDPSNQSREFLRNRIRHELLPQLEEYNPRIRSALWRSARTLADDHAILEETLDQVWSDCLLREQVQEIALAADRFLGCSIGQQRYLVRRVLERLARDRVDLRFDVLDRAVSFLMTEREGRQDLSGGVRLTRVGKELIFSLTRVEAFQGTWPQMRDPEMGLPVSGEVDLGMGWRLCSDRIGIESLDLNQVLHSDDPFRAWLDADRLPGRLHVRTPRPGDRLQPMGMSERSMKLSDLFINEKVPQPARANWPLVCAGEVIVWVPGHRLAHTSRLTGETHQVLVLKLTRESR